MQPFSVEDRWTAQRPPCPWAPLWTDILHTQWSEPLALAKKWAKQNWTNMPVKMQCKLPPTYCSSPALQEQLLAWVKEQHLLFTQHTSLKIEHLDIFFPPPYERPYGGRKPELKWARRWKLRMCIDRKYVKWGTFNVFFFFNMNKQNSSMNQVKKCQVFGFMTALQLINW